MRQGQKHAKPPKSAKDYQALTPSTEYVLEKWTLQMGSQGFPPMLDLFKATTEELFQQQLRNEPDATMIALGQTWLRGFLNRHPAVHASLHHRTASAHFQTLWGP